MSDKKYVLESMIQKAAQGNVQKPNLIWLEAQGCSGNIISMMNADNPDIIFVLKNMVNMTYSNSLMFAEGQSAYDSFLKTLDTDFILVVEGAVSLRSEGRYNIIAKNGEKNVTGMEAIKAAGEKAKHVLAVGTCAYSGGISAASPNPSSSIGVGAFLKRKVINIPGCPIHPDWVIGTLAHLVLYGEPELDNEQRPIMFYGSTIHDNCTRRSYFDKKIFAKSLGDKECMFRLGCRGPITRSDCPIRKWNSYVNWPVGDNSPCIGCAHRDFPDGMEPFIN